MQKLNAELSRLYLAQADGGTRSIALAFRKLPGDGEAGHWERLCSVANALQAELGLPAPAVSISGAGAYGIWLSLEKAVPVALAQEFIELVCAAFCPGMNPAPNAASPAAALPPYMEQSTGKWSAFIHPGMGASFAGDEGLEIEPPQAGQVALLEGLESIGPALFGQALDQLRQKTGGAPQPIPAPLPPAAPAQDVLLKDATLEDIVSFLHSKNIEPTFRFVK